ncbi:hypothetical protein [Amycolatopsis rubida]|uniref:Uncharacterized protein n=1 Tax=Amycolatopsis rubida TaxID=112413 RepID=A0A1I5XHK8_9PSEU|nr:hypothetical protein [Amycolatopsis rubida]SFQ31455.1 hypothetical protein SAMN05421854_110240 [Amycolatopsis rubida]
MGARVMSEDASGLVSSRPPKVFTAAEADERLRDWEPTEHPYVLKISGGSDDDYFGLHGTLGSIEAVLAHALEEVRDARDRQCCGRQKPALERAIQTWLRTEARISAARAADPARELAALWNGGDRVYRNARNILDRHVTPEEYSPKYLTDDLADHLNITLRDD